MSTKGAQRVGRRGGGLPITSSLALFLTAASLALPAPVNAASLDINPSTVQNDLVGTITFTISGIAAGEKVTVEKFLDTNGNGVIDGDEFSVSAFRVTDGVVPMIGGVRDLNVPGDEDEAANSQIRSDVAYPSVEPAIDRIAGQFVYRVSNSSGMPIATAPFTVQQVPAPQGVTGHITALSGSQPLARIPVVLAPPNGSPVTGTLTDINGDYTLYSAPGSYVVVPVTNGYVGDSSAAVTVAANQFAVKNLALPSAPFAVSGRVTDADTHTGLPGLLVVAESEDNLFALGFTDSSGNYSFMVTAGQWGISVNEGDASRLGYVGARDRTNVTVSGDVTDLNFELTKANALIYGTLKDNQGAPITGVGMHADDDGNQYEARGMTFPPTGNYTYTLGVLAGTWYVEPSSDDLGARGYFGQSITVSVASGEAVRRDFTAQPFTAHLRGHVTANSTPIGNVWVSACLQGQGGSCPGAETGADGSFDIGVYTSGTWNLHVSSDDTAPLNLIGAQLQVVVVADHDQNGISIVLQPAPYQITGTVRDSNQQPLTNVGVSAWTTISGTQYNAYDETDGDGNYTLHVLNATWNVGVNCNDLHGIPCFSNRNVTVDGSNETVDFIAGAACVGDCGNQQVVSIDNIFTMVAIALGEADISVCQNSAHMVTVTQVLAAIHNAVDGCNP